ncbi:MAG: heavy-metal-associated domain-containing protein [Treponema sp.]|nr:heavy-metal-associated domain-containing protein [Treponema sp.]
MINVVIVFILIIFICIGVRSYIKHLKGESSCCGGGNGILKIQPADKNRSNYKYKAEIKIPEIMCSNCIMKISNALNGQDGIWAEKINLKSKTAYVLLKEGITEESVKDIIQKAGYAVENYSCSEL